MWPEWTCEKEWNGAVRKCWKADEIRESKIGGLYSWDLPRLPAASSLRVFHFGVAGRLSLLCTTVRAGREFMKRPSTINSRNLFRSASKYSLIDRYFTTESDDCARRCTCWWEIFSPKTSSNKQENHASTFLLQTTHKYSTANISTVHALERKFQRAWKISLWKVNSTLNTQPFSAIMNVVACYYHQFKCISVGSN